jgi:uncharacterized protein (DUF433 family)
MPIPTPGIPHPHVVLEDGVPFVEDSRVPVHRLFSWHRQGTSVETLLRRYPQIGPARILDALAFAYDNQDVIAAAISMEREELERENTERVKKPWP